MKKPMISYKGAHFPKDVILYRVSYPDIDAIFEERSAKADHSTLNRWVINYLSYLALAAKKVSVLLPPRGVWIKPKRSPFNTTVT
jgi:transposase-like protein